MNLRIYLFAILLTWATAFAGFTLIKHGLLVFALLVLLAYWCMVLAVAFKLEKFDNDDPFHFIGAHDKRPRPSEDCE